MYWNTSIPVSEHVNQTFRPLMIIGRVFGLFPISIIKKGTQLFWKWSPLYLFYSYSFGIILPVLTYRGLLKDVMADNSKSIKIKSHTDMYVAFCDVTVLELVVFFGTFTTAFYPSDVFKFIKCLNEVDSIIPPTDIKSSRNVSIVVIVTVLIISSAITISDLLLYLTISGERSGTSFILECYLPFYITYYVVLMHQYKFWHAALSVLKRLSRLNCQLEFSNFKNDNLENFSLNNKRFTVSQQRSNGNLEPKGVAYIVDKLTTNNEIKVLTLRKPNANIKPTTNYIFKMMVVYETLCDAVDILNRLYGLTNAITIIGILWHLIETPYLLISEITGNRKDFMYISIMAAWCSLHIARLSFLAQNCYGCVLQSQKTKDLVCKLLFSCEHNLQLKSQLQDFSLILLHRKLEFTASGLTAIDRSLVTSVLGAITTYLVILLQFATTEG